MHRIAIITLQLLACVSFNGCGAQGEYVPPVHSPIRDAGEPDPALKEMSFDIGYGPEYFMAYVQPDISNFTQDETSKVVKPRHNGHAAKFINMGPSSVRLYWVGGGNVPFYMNNCKAFGTTGTASFPGHRFFFAPHDYDYETNDVRLISFVINDKDMIYYYDPVDVPGNPVETENNMKKLSYEELEKYDIVKRNRLFDEQYREFTGRNYLSMYPRPQPSHHIWPADYFGQEHWVTTKEVHFQEVPKDKLGEINHFVPDRALKEDDPRLLQEYRTEGMEEMNMTLKVISCAPRAFEIENFLSDTEVDHILYLANASDMKLSTTATADEVSQAEKKKSSTRTSFNTWVSRETDQVIDSIYRRASDLLMIDEAKIRYRGDKEYPDLGSKRSIGESLQLVHYDIAQEYTAHHDFGYSDAGEKRQPARFATLLLYLNEGMEGGETEFPRWVNAETKDGLAVTPQRRKAALFYNQLPDGNMDELSQHAALPIKSGEKFLINLWVWDPIYEY